MVLHSLERRVGFKSHRRRIRNRANRRIIRFGQHRLKGRIDPLHNLALRAKIIGQLQTGQGQPL